MANTSVVCRTSAFAFAKLVAKAGTMAAPAFLREVVEAPPDRVHTGLPPLSGDHGIQAAPRKQDRHAFAHAAGIACDGARRLETLRGLTPNEYAVKYWTRQPDRFEFNP